MLAGASQTSALSPIRCGANEARRFFVQAGNLAVDLTAKRLEEGGAIRRARGSRRVGLAEVGVRPGLKCSRVVLRPLRSGARFAKMAGARAPKALIRRMSMFNWTSRHRIRARRTGYRCSSSPYMTC